MAILSKEQMETLLADNTAGDISAQDMRDIIAGLVGRVVTPPSYNEGESYYHNGVLNIMGEYSDIILRTGREMHMRVINNTGVTMAKGKAVRHNGVVAGEVQIALALADSFVHARILGVTAHEILDGQTGIITTFGIIENIDTAGLPTGTPLFLSDTTAGEFSTTIPSIISRVGGALVADASTGKLFVSIVNNKNLPIVFGGMQGQVDNGLGVGVYALNSTAQDLADYGTEKEVVITVDAATGEITLSNTGEHRANFIASLSFPSTTSTRTVYFELYDVTNDDVHFTYPMNIPRDATEDAVDFNFPIDELVGNVHKMRMRAVPDVDIVITDVSFDVQSVSIR